MSSLRLSRCETQLCRKHDQNVGFCYRLFYRYRPWESGDCRLSCRLKDNPYRASLQIYFYNFLTPKVTLFSVDCESKEILTFNPPLHNSWSLTFLFIFCCKNRENFLVCDSKTDQVLTSLFAKCLVRTSRYTYRFMLQTKNAFSVFMLTLC